MKKGLVFFIIIIALFIGAIFIPWNDITSIRKLFGIENGVKYSSLKVYSLGGNLKVSVDEEEKGVAYFDMSYLEITPIDSGFHQVELVRESTEESFYTVFTREVYFEEGFDVVISWELGPSERSSSGWVLSARRDTSDTEFSEKTNLFVEVDPIKAEFLIDDSKVEDYSGGVLLSLDERHKITCRESGFQDIDFEILPEDAYIRKTLNEYSLYLDIKLYEIPFKL